MSDAPKTRVYLDTEFTSLNRATSKLISLALVVHEGPELYVQLNDTWDVSDCSDFVRDTVLPQLDHTRYGCTSAAAQLAVSNWLEQFQSIEVFTDAPQWDWFHFEALLGNKGIPSHVELAELSIAHLAYVDDQDAPHHALKDARLLANIMEVAAR